ncbi:DUF2179 domain-containing protein [Candidatus Woesearchaeota archaeon]|nr:DUF2179 domain-containing protein [Candidatus Woesearchaeota archaeon]
MFPATPLYTLGVIPLLIFLARIVDVSMGTIRMIFIARGYRGIAPILGFFEVIIWLLAIQQIMQNLSNPITYIAYAGGFAAGTYIGIIIEDRISIGKVMLRILTNRDASRLVKAFHNADFIATVTESRGRDGDVRDIFSILERKNLHQAIDIMNKYNPNAFFSVTDVRYASERKHKHRHLRKTTHVRKGK